MSQTPDTPFSLGLNCKLKWKPYVSETEPSPTGLRELRVVDVSFNDSMSMASVNDRGAGGYEQQVPTLRTVGLDFEMIYDPTDEVNFRDFYDCYATRQRVVLFAEDDRGNAFAAIYQISNFDMTQALTEAQTCSVQCVIGRGDWTPRWIYAD